MIKKKKKKVKEKNNIMRIINGSLHYIKITIHLDFAVAFTE